MSDNFYKAFEDRYRGSRDVITQRLRAYLPVIAPLAALYDRARALDLGCGRGEWLELAGSAGFDAHGVDLDDGMLAACRERGLAVETADAIATLRAMPDTSLALISAFHLVEHMPFDAVRTLIAESLRVLQPGGLLIMETPNPENLVVGASSFYMDPSHERPIPSQLLAFAAEHGGFARNMVVRLQEPTDVHSNVQFGLHHVLDGVSPDYAVIAQKAAAAEVLERFDAAFSASYGMALGTAMQRFDVQAAQQRGRVDSAAAYGELALDQVDGVRATTHQLGASVHQLGANVAHAHNDLIARMNHLEACLVVTDQRGQQLAATLSALQSSYAWRISAPLRWAEHAAYRVVRARRNGTIIAGLKRRAVTAARMAGKAVLRNAAAKRATRTLLARFPRLQARLRDTMYYHVETSGLPPPSSQPADDLSPRAQRIYDSLKKTQENKEI